MCMRERARVAQRQQKQTSQQTENPNRLQQPTTQAEERLVKLQNLCFNLREAQPSRTVGQYQHGTVTTSTGSGIGMKLNKNKAHGEKYK